MFLEACQDGDALRLQKPFERAHEPFWRAYVPLMIDLWSNYDGM